MKIIQWLIDNLNTLKTIIFYLCVYEGIKWLIRFVFYKIFKQTKKN